MRFIGSNSTEIIEFHFVMVYYLQNECVCICVRLQDVQPPMTWLSPSQLHNSSFLFFLLSFYLPLLLFCHNVRLFVYLFFSLHADLLLVSVSVVEMAHWESFSHLWHQLFLFIAASLWPVGWLLSSFFLLFCCVWCLLWNKMFSTLFFSSFNFTTSVSAQTVFTGMRGDCKV